MALTISDRKQIRPELGAICQMVQIAANESGAIQLGDAVLVNSDGRLTKARANAVATTFAKGIVVAGEGIPAGTSYVADQWVSVCFFGPVVGITGMDPTEPVFVSSATAGGITQTAPTGAGSWTHAIGYALRPDMLWVMPEAEAPASNS